MGGNSRRKARIYQAPLVNSINEETILNVAEEFVSIIASIPRVYDVLFPVPNFEVSKDVHLTDTIIFTRTPDNPKPGEVVNVLSGSWVPLPRLNTTYLRVRSRGFVTNKLGQSAMKDALSLMKRVIQIGTIKHAFKRDVSRERAQRGRYGISPEAIDEAFVYDLSDPAIPPVSVRLAWNTWRHLDRLSIYDETKQTVLPPPLISSKRKEEDLQRLIALSVSLVTESEAEENTKSLRSALEWAFDSDADDEPMMSFIKTCIALEAALGEESDSDQITERLADRCAFLLNKTSQDRRSTRRIVKDVYRLRSKLVHGVKTKFDHQDDRLALMGAVHLSLVLATEIRAVEAWWRHRERR